MHNEQNTPTRRQDAIPRRGLWIDERGLQHYNDLKPVTRKLFWWTLKSAGKMIKWVVKAAFHLPGLVKKMAPRVMPQEPVRRATHSNPPAQK
jgi:hypothetical protein